MFVRLHQHQTRLHQDHQHRDDDCIGEQHRDCLTIVSEYTADLERDLAERESDSEWHTASHCLAEAENERFDIIEDRG